MHEELASLRRTFDLRWEADMRAIKRWQAAHPGNDLVWPDHADMVVWLLERSDEQSNAVQKRALAAVPCMDGKLDCSCFDYPWSPCCNLRVALWAGEPFHVDHLADGILHLFEPTMGPEPKKSAGCVKLIEPTIYERNETRDWNFR